MRSNIGKEIEEHITTLSNRPCFRAFQSHCQRHHKCGSRHHVSGGTWLDSSLASANHFSGIGAAVSGAPAGPAISEASRFQALQIYN
jgi:hypothetical protein